MPALAAVLLLGAACGSVAKPTGWAAPALQGDTLYVTLQHGKLDAYRLSEGQQRLWEFPEKDAKLPLTVKDGQNLSAPRSEKISFEGLYGDPVVTADGIYATAYSGHVIALEKDGRARWVAELPGREIGGALVMDDTVYAGATNGELFALAKDSGTVRWRRAAGKEIWSRPVQSDNLILVSTMSGSIVAYDRDGNERWNTKLTDSAIASTPTLVGDRLFVGAFDKYLYALNARTGERLWSTPEAADNWFWTEILAQGDTLFAGSLGGTVYAIDAGAGATRWSVKVGDMIRSRPAILNDVLVVGSKDGRLHGLRPADGSRVWEETKSPMADDPSAPRGDLYADLLPVRDRNGMYVTTERGRKDGRLYFLDLNERRVSELTLR